MPPGLAESLRIGEPADVRYGTVVHLLAGGISITLTSLSMGTRSVVVGVGTSLSAWTSFWGGTSFWTSFWCLT